MKKNIITIGAIAILLGIMLMPCINAMMLEIKTTTVESIILKEDVLTKRTENKDYEPAYFGSIYGQTYGHQGWMMYPLPGVIVEARSGTLVKRDRSNIFCYYKIRGLPVDHTYTVTASYPGFNSETITVTLTSDRPHVRVSFDLEKK